MGAESNVGIAYEDMTPEQRLEFIGAFHEGQPRTAEEWIRHCLKLTTIEYDQQRESIAKKLDIRVSTLDAEVERFQPSKSKSEDGILLTEPEPWHSAVSGWELLNALRSIFERYVVLPAGASAMLALWTIHTYMLDAAEASPIVGVSSPEKRCGKTIVLELLQAVAFKPLPASNITAAALFRTIEAFKPTILIDEADSFLRDNEELRGVLNSGHRKATAIIIRTTGDNFEPKTFSTWCPKAIALIGKLPSTLEDRSIVITMRRKSRDESVERIRRHVLRADTFDLQRKAVRWADDNIHSVRVTDPAIPGDLNDRAADCWRPLFAIAEVVGGDWPDLARQAALSLAIGDDSSSGVQLLSDIRTIFERQKVVRMTSEIIVEELNGMEDRPWPEWKHGKPLSKSQLARQLNKFDIIVKTIRLTPTTTAKGYEFSQFDDAFSRYLPSQSVTPSQPAPVLNCDGFENVTPQTPVTFLKTSQPAPVLNCDGVTLSNPLHDEETI